MSSDANTAQTASPSETPSGTAAAAAPASSDIPPDSSVGSQGGEQAAAAAAATVKQQTYLGNAFPHFPSEQASRPAPPDAHASYAYSPFGAHTPSAGQMTPALSSGHYDSSVPGTPSEYAGSATQFVPNPALALGTPLREMGHLSLADSPSVSGASSVSLAAAGGSVSPAGEVTGVGSEVHHAASPAAAAAVSGSVSPSSGANASSAAIEQVLARTSAGQQALREGSLPHPKNLAIPMPGPMPGAGTPASPSLNGAVGTPGGGQSNVATPGSTRAGTPADLMPPPSSLPSTAPQSKKEGSSGALAPKRPSNGPVESGRTMSTATTSSTEAAANHAQSSHAHHPVPPPLKEKKSVFGKLFDRDRTASSSTVNSDAGSQDGHASAEIQRRASSSGAHGGGGQLEPPSLARRVSGGSSMTRKEDQKREEKERKEREKSEKKERERREKEEQREQKERLRAQRTPSQTGRSRSGSHGHKERDSSVAPSAGGREKESGGGGGMMDFMRGKVQRKTSVTSRKSDDARSEKSHHYGDSQYGGSETKSRGGQSNASLNKKYGVCDKVIVGKGATAVVRLAHKWDRSTEKLYAVKEFRKRRKNETEKEYVKKLTSEFCISSTLHHHNIVETVDLVQDEQQHWCEVMEYCPGGDLYAVIKKGDLGSAEINSYFKQIIAGVAYLHSMGVAHRDIKPENLLLDGKGHVKITDFGVSDVFRMCWEKTTHLSKGLCGSEPYIAPEQFEQKEYDARLVDIWAVAVVYYCMTYQELPWRVAKQNDPSFGSYAQLYKTSSSTPPPVSNIVPRECRSVIRRMLNPDPKYRLTTDEVIADPWFASIEVIPPITGILPPKPTMP
ncbi:hypothetical protein BMF94_7036 [Rhodotorula taiwanensis]|uniref:non-specific serine/threonine protein kinase n=1 Tax=Rhodotorula taiwanensis TaxID=741276 RepID=A0A2S5AZM4_9BASI|nr:hypothetical protein BMF94_7036 [Rhodotorula taiwanensis]